MDGKILARLAELPGAVERIDDPHALGRQPAGVIVGLLAQDRIIGTMLRERCCEQLLGFPVALLAQKIRSLPVCRINDPEGLPQFEQPGSCLARDHPGQFGIVQHRLCAGLHGHLRPFRRVALASASVVVNRASIIE